MLEYGKRILVIINKLSCLEHWIPGSYIDQPGYPNGSCLGWGGAPPSPPPSSAPASPSACPSPSPAPTPAVFPPVPPRSAGVPNTPSHTQSQLKVGHKSQSTQERRSRIAESSSRVERPRRTEPDWRIHVYSCWYADGRLATKHSPV